MPVMSKRHSRAQQFTFLCMTMSYFSVAQVKFWQILVFLQGVRFDNSETFLNLLISDFNVYLVHVTQITQDLISSLCRNDHSTQYSSSFSYVYFLSVKHRRNLEPEEKAICSGQTSLSAYTKIDLYLKMMILVYQTYWTVASVRQVLVKRNAVFLLKQ